MIKKTAVLPTDREPLDFSLRLLPFIVMILSFSILHGHTIKEIVVLWFTKPHTYAQGALILLITIYMIYTQRSQLKRLPIIPSFLWGAFLTLGGGILYLLGQLTDTVTAQQVALIVMLMGLILLVLGWHYFKALFFIVGYLIFLFPIVSALLGSQVIVLQNISAVIASGLLKLMGFSVFRHNHMVQLPHIALDVVAACSGINHIVSLVAIAIPLSVVSGLRKLGKLLMVFAAIAIGIFANGLRVALIGVWVYLFKDAKVHGPGDILLISFVFIFGMMTLLFVGYILKKRKDKDRSRSMKEVQDETIASRNTQLNLIAVVVAIIILIGIKGLSSIYEPHAILPEADLLPLPNAVGDWGERPVGYLDERFIGIDTDRYWFKQYQSPEGRVVYAFVGYFAKQNEGHEVFGSAVKRLIGVYRKDKVLCADTPAREMMDFKFASNNSTYKGLAAYLINGRFYADIMPAKLASLKNTLTKRRNNGSVLIFLIPQSQMDAAQNQIEIYSNLLKTLMVQTQDAIP